MFMRNFWPYFFTEVFQVNFGRWSVSFNLLRSFHSVAVSGLKLGHSRRKIWISEGIQWWVYFSRLGHWPDDHLTSAKLQMVNSHLFTRWLFDIKLLDILVCVNESNWSRPWASEASIMTLSSPCFISQMQGRLLFCVHIVFAYHCQILSYINAPPKKQLFIPIGSAFGFTIIKSYTMASVWFDNDLFGYKQLPWVSVLCFLVSGKWERALCGQ